MVEGIEISHLRLRRQWVLLLAGDSIPDRWQSYKFSTGEVLAWHPDLPVEVWNVGKAVILVLGVLVDLSAPESPREVRHPIALERGIEEWLDSAAGNYVVMEHRQGVLRIYTDPGAMCGVYFKDNRASSTPTLLPGFEKDTDLLNEYPLKGTDDWYTGSVCPFIGVRVLIANHYLEPRTEKIGRFWPRRVPPGVSRAEGVEAAAKLLRRIVTTVCKRGDLLISLTGGKDSRVNLAAARKVCSKAEFFTLKSDRVKRCDIEIAGILASRFSLNHRFVDVPPSEGWLVDLYDEVSGGIALGARRDILGACLKLQGARTTHLSGNLGAIAKAYYWRSANPGEFSKELLLRDFVNIAPCIIEGLDEWLATLPDGLPASVVYNLMYLEQRGGRWMGVGENASSLFYNQFSAFNSRQIFELISGIPGEAQYHGDLHLDLIRVLWPELLEIPFCKPSRKISVLLPKRLKDSLKRLLRR